MEAGGDDPLTITTRPNIFTPTKGKDEKGPRRRRGKQARMSMPMNTYSGPLSEPKDNNAALSRGGRRSSDFSNTSSSNYAKAGDYASTMLDDSSSDEVRSAPGHGRRLKITRQSDDCLKHEHLRGRALTFTQAAPVCSPTTISFKTNRPVAPRSLTRRTPTSSRGGARRGHTLKDRRGVRQTHTDPPICMRPTPGGSSCSASRASPAGSSVTRSGA
jgi:hypothetical protein